MDIQKLKNTARNIGHMNGVSFDSLTVYRIELIHLKNDGHSDKSIAQHLSSLCGLHVTKDNVNKWFIRQSQPKEQIIEALEDLFKLRHNSARSA